MNGKKTPGRAGTHTFGSFRALDHGDGSLEDHKHWDSRSTSAIPRVAVEDEIGNLFIGLFPGVLLHLLHIV